MKSQTALFLDKARQQLGRADTMLRVGLNEDAGRAAYLAGLHAAQAFIFENTEGAQKAFRRAARIRAAGERQSAL